ncbi:HAD-IIA family hydrolase [uncultured Rhodospira sp.]|uniref:HAD-IIA family hydrolase n=1 Tax=uncultured Rhodospira sp. TaxID=1936189 RepID=UPI00262FB9D5|nr:HAD-IIA family hydrolase [uncultured Rhodospira sp.]
MPEPLRLTVVTDIHHGADTGVKIGSRALPFLEQVIREANRARPDLVLDLGDRISDVDHATDRRLMAGVADVFDGLEVPRAHIVGNHDVATLSVDENARILGQDMGHRVIEANGWRLVLWQADTFIPYPDPFRPRPSDLTWLAETLAAAETPAIVLTHVPLGGGSMAGNYYFDSNPHMATYPEHAEIRRVIEDSRHVALCLAGHVHWNSVQTVDAVPYLTVQSLTESFTTPGRACGAWADLDIRADRVRLRVAGLDSLDMTIPLRAPATRWTPRMSAMPRARDRRGRTDAPLDLRDVSGLILDLDGVLYRGAEAIPNAPAFLDALTARGLPYVLLTNNARATAITAAAKLKGLGMPVPAERIVTAGWATCRGLDARGRHRVRVFGPATLHAEARAAGLDIDPGAQTPDAVLVGYDPALRVGDLAEAARLVRAGAALVATNPDPTIPGADGLDPECGALVAFLETATGRRAEIGGKPSRDIVHHALERLGLPAHGVLMVGDTLETDIAGAAAAGLRSVLVATGNTATLDDIDGASVPAPTACVASLTDLLDRLGPPTERIAG